MQKQNEQPAKKRKTVRFLIPEPEPQQPVQQPLSSPGDSDDWQIIKGIWKQVHNPEGMPNANESLESISEASSPELISGSLEVHNGSVEDNSSSGASELDQATHNDCFQQQTTQQPPQSNAIVLYDPAAAAQQIADHSKNLILSPVQPSVCRAAFPPFDASPQPLGKKMDHSSPDLPIREPQHLALDLLAGTPNNPVQVNLSLFPPGTDKSQNEEELVLLRNNYMSFPNKWKLSNLLVDYDTIRFAYWHERWPVTRRLALTERERLSLKRVKIFGLSRFLMANLLKNLSSLTSLEHLEIDKLEICAVHKPKRTFKFLKVFSVDSVSALDIFGKEMAPKSFLTIDAPNLKFLFLG